MRKTPFMGTSHIGESPGSGSDGQVTSLYDKHFTVGLAGLCVRPWRILSLFPFFCNNKNVLHIPC